ncbi:MAG: glycosyltransferase, partial [Acidobacteriota bacterium]
MQRASKLAKYLPGTGWKPVVLTKRRDYPPFDQELVRDSREVEVIRAKTLELPERWLALPGLRTLVRLVRSFSVPDQGIWWLPSAYAAAVRRARGESFRAIVATGGPFSTFLLALALRRRLQLPLVLDFRDPWTSNPRRQPRAWYVFWRDRIERWMERAALRRADAVVTVNPEMLDELCWPKGEKSASDCRRVAIPNGFDSDDFREPGPSPIPRQRPGSVHLVYVGGLLQEYRPAEVLLKGMRHFVALRPEVDLHCHIVGDNAPRTAR